MGPWNPAVNTVGVYSPQPSPLTVGRCLLWASSCLLTQSFSHPFCPHLLSPKKPLTLCPLVDSPSQTGYSPLLFSSVLWGSPCPIVNKVKEEMRPRLEGVGLKATENKRLSFLKQEKRERSSKKHGSLMPLCMVDTGHWNPGTFFIPTCVHFDKIIFKLCNSL